VGLLAPLVDHAGSVGLGLDGGFDVGVMILAERGQGQDEGGQGKGGRGDEESVVIHGKIS